MIAPATTPSWTNCATFRRTPTSFWSSWRNASVHAAGSRPKGQLQPVHGYYIEIGRSSHLQACRRSAARRSKRRALHHAGTQIVRGQGVVGPSVAVTREVAVRGTAGSAVEPRWACCSTRRTRSPASMCSVGFAERAQRLDLCRPTFRDSPGLTVSGAPPGGGTGQRRTVRRQRPVDG